MPQRAIELISEPIRVPRKHRVHTAVTTALALCVVFTVVTSMARNPRFQWSVVGEYLFHASILAGIWVTIYLTVIAMTVGVVGGVFIYLIQRSANRLLALIGWAYIWFFRGTPLLVQLIFWYNLSALYPTLNIGIPFGPSLGGPSVNAIISPFVAACLGLGLHEAALMAEIIRGGVIGVSSGQSEAAFALGMTQRRRSVE